MATRTDGAGSSGLLMVLGVLLILGGVLAVLLPGPGAIAATLVAGWVLLLIGIAGISIGVRTRRRHGRVSDIVMGLLSLVAGIVILLDPLRGLVSLTFVLSLWLLVRGIMELIGASRSAGRMRLLLVLAGLVDLLLAGLLFFNYPYPAIFMVGLFVGISLLFRGLSTVMIAAALRRA